MNIQTFNAPLANGIENPGSSFASFITEKYALLLSQPAPSELSWWVEISTSVPLCTYYFGPFDSQKEARDSRSSYVDDLLQEEARDIVALVKQGQPVSLTVDQGYSFTRA